MPSLLKEISEKSVYATMISGSRTRNFNTVFSDLSILVRLSGLVNSFSWFRLRRVDYRSRTI